MATETLRPSGVGSQTELAPSAGANWECVDEAESDGGASIVTNSDVQSELVDLYALPASGVGAGVINSVKVYVHCAGLSVTKGRPWLRTHSTNYPGTFEFLTVPDYVYNTETWSVNPNTESAWTWAEIDALEAGVGMECISESVWARCTQVYVEVDYEPVTPKTSSDTGSGVDAKTTGNPLATYSRDETGSGVEAKASENPLATLVKAETGSGLEHILDRIIFLTSEAGTGLDTILALLGKTSSEIGSGLENSYLHILEAVKTGSDSGSGADASSLIGIFERDETGEGLEQVIARALFSREPQMGAIDLARVITAAITGTGETGSGAEASLVSFYQKKTDSGGGVDSSTLEALFARDDSGSGVEAITLLAAMLALDSGQGIETVLTYLRKLVDSGEGAEVAELIGYVGRRMRMIVYQREAFNLAVYTSETGK